MKFHIADQKEIKEGKITDVYFERTLTILKAKGIDKRVKTEFIVKTLPKFPGGEWDWAVLAGIEECAELLQGLKVSVRAMREGTIFHPYEPVMEIEGRYTEFGVYETALLGFICQASGIATQAARCKKLAGDRKVISFGARRMHPAIAPMIERSAYIGGCDGVAVVKSAELIEEEASGTMPHALVILMGGSIQAVKAFHEVIDPKIKRVALVDTFNDEKFEAIGVAQALGKDLYGVRLDTPASRRGNFAKILEEVRWELDLRGFRDVKIFVSGGIEEAHITALNPFVDAYGIGTSISNAPVVDFAMDIMEVEGEPLAKRGKMSGAKQVLRCPKCFSSVIVPLREQRTTCACGGHYEALLMPWIKDGKILERLPKPAAIRKSVLAQLQLLPPILVAKGN